MKRLIVSLIVLVTCGNLWAEAHVAHAGVVYVRVDRSGKGIVKFDKVLTGTPAACGTSHPNHLSFDTNQPSGNAIMSLALAAQASGRTILARGTNTCGEYGTVESWNYGWVSTD